MAPNNLVQFPTRTPVTATTALASTAPAATGQQHAPLPVTPLLSSRDAFVLRETTYGRIIGREPVLDVAARRFGDQISDVVVVTSNISTSLTTSQLATMSGLGVFVPTVRANILRALATPLASAANQPEKNAVELPLPVFFFAPFAMPEKFTTMNDYFFFRRDWQTAIRFRHWQETERAPQSLGSIFLKNSMEGNFDTIRKMIATFYSRSMKDKKINRFDLSFTIGMLIRFEVDNYQMADIFGKSKSEFQGRREFSDAAWAFLSALEAVDSNRSPENLKNLKSAHEALSSI